MPRFIYDLRFRTFLFGLFAVGTAFVATGESGRTLVLRLFVLAVLTLLALSSAISWRREGRWASTSWTQLKKSRDRPVR